MEYLDTYDELGNFIKKEERKTVHQLGLWHNTVHCWLYDLEGNIYFQIRSDLKKLYTTASGHVQAGETIKEAFGREIEEEIGYHVDYESARKISIVKFMMDRKEKDGSIFKDRAFANVYALPFKGSLTEFNFDENELAGIAKINAKEALEIIKKEEGSLIGEVSSKKDGIIHVENKEITFDDFLVNPSEIAIEKYGEVLTYIIQAIEKNER